MYHYSFPAASPRYFVVVSVLPSRYKSYECAGRLSDARQACLHFKESSTCEDTFRELLKITIVIPAYACPQRVRLLKRCRRACPKNIELEHFSQAGRNLPQMNPLFRRSLPVASVPVLMSQVVRLQRCIMNTLCGQACIRNESATSEDTFREFLKITIVIPAHAGIDHK